MYLSYYYVKIEYIYCLLTKYIIIILYRMNSFSALTNSIGNGLANSSIQSIHQYWKNGYYDNMAINPFTGRSVKPINYIRKNQDNEYVSDICKWSNLLNCYIRIDKTQIVNTPDNYIIFGIFIRWFEKCVFYGTRITPPSYILDNNYVDSNDEAEDIENNESECDEISDEDIEDEDFIDDDSDFTDNDYEYIPDSKKIKL